MSDKILKSGNGSLVKILLGEQCLVYTLKELEQRKPWKPENSHLPKLGLADTILAVNYNNKGYPMSGTVINHHSREGCYEVDSKGHQLIFHLGRLTPIYDIRKIRQNSFVYDGSIKDALREFEKAGFREIESPNNLLIKNSRKR